MAVNNLMTLHASQVSKWLDCPERAIAEAIEPAVAVHDTMTVGAVVGDRVHHELTGHTPSKYKSIVYDNTTRNGKELERETKKIIDMLDAYLEHKQLKPIVMEYQMELEYHWDNMSVELRGTIDSIVEDPKGKLHIIDFKTGRGIPHKALVQLSIYAYIYNETIHDSASVHNLDAATSLHLQTEQIESVICIYCPRNSIHKIFRHDPVQTISVPYLEAVSQGEDMIRHAFNMCFGTTKPYYNPSREHCFGCRVDCPYHYERQAIEVKIND